LRWLGAGENARARELLERLQRQHPAACVVAGTLTAFLERHAALPAELAQVLGSTAASLEDAELAASLCIEAGLRRWQGGRDPAAALDFDSAERHVPGAANRPFSENLADGTRFKAPALLRAEFSALLGDVAPERVVHMCGSGVTACHNLLAMEVAGLHGSRVYAPSWSGWLHDRERPVATGDA